MLSIKNFKNFSVYSGLPKEVYIIFAAKIITSMGSFIIPLWTLILTSKIGISKPNAGALTALLTVVQALCLILGGKFIDKLGRKKVLCFCQIVGALLYVACGILPVTMLTAGIIMTTAALYTTANPALDALLADYTNPENRKQSYSLIYFGANLGYAIGPLLSGLLFNDFLWLLFLLDAVTTIVSVTLIFINVKEPILKANNLETKKREKVTEKRFAAICLLLKKKEILAFIFIIGLFQFCIAEWSFLLPLQLTDYFKEDGAKYYGILIMITAAVVVVFTPAATSLTKGIHSLAVVALGGIFYSIAYIMFGFTKNFFVFILGGVILTIGEILVIVNNNTFIAERTPSQFRGRVYSIYQLTLKVFEGVSPVIMGSVIVVAGYLTSWVAVAITMASGAVLMFLLSRKTLKEQDSEIY